MGSLIAGQRPNCATLASKFKLIDETRLEPFGDKFTDTDLDKLEVSAGFKLPRGFREFYLRNQGCFVDGNSSVRFADLTSDLLQFHGKKGSFDPYSKDTALLRLGDPTLRFPKKSIIFADDLGGNSYYLAPPEEAFPVFWMGYLTDEVAQLSVRALKISWA